MQTNLSQSIDITANKSKYDESVKELFADRQVLAWILKYTLEEFADDAIPEIMLHLSQPVISSIRMEPGQTNQGRIEKQSEEDVVVGEGKIYYDIRFSAYHGKEQIKILVNIEAQKSTSPSRLGYHLDKKKMAVEPIKSLGVHNVTLKLHPEVTAKLKVKVVEK